MGQLRIRVFDILTEKEREKLANYKEAICDARTPLGIYFNKVRAEKLLANARLRHSASNEYFK